MGYGLRIRRWIERDPSNRRLLDLYFLAGCADADLRTHHGRDSHGLLLIEWLTRQATLEHASPGHLPEHHSLIRLAIAAARTDSDVATLRRLLRRKYILLHILEPDLLPWTP